MSTKFSQSPTTRRLAMMLLCTAMLLPAALAETRASDAGKRQVLKLLSETASQHLKRLALTAPFQGLH